MTFYYILNYVIGIPILIHAMTLSPSAWAKADRNKSFWMPLMAIFTLFPAAVFIDVPYLLLVLPGTLGSSSGSTSSSPYAKKRD
jgi:hypothetical protein